MDPKLILALNMGSKDQPIVMLVQLDYTEGPGVPPSIITTYAGFVDSKEKFYALLMELRGHIDRVLDEEQIKH